MFLDENEMLGSLKAWMIPLSTGSHSAVGSVRGLPLARDPRPPLVSWEVWEIAAGTFVPKDGYSRGWR